MVKMVILPAARHIPVDMLLEAMGFIPHWLDDRNPEPAAVQLGKNYAHGGGWHPFSTTDNPKFKIGKDMSLQYPGDPAHKAYAKFILRDEEVYMYDHAWVMVYDTKTKRHEICRMD